MVYYIHRQVQYIQIQVNKKDLQNFKKVLTKVNENDILTIQGKQYNTYQTNIDNLIKGFTSCH